MDFEETLLVFDRVQYQHEIHYLSPETGGRDITIEIVGARVVRVLAVYHQPLVAVFPWAYDRIGDFFPCKGLSIEKFFRVLVDVLDDPALDCFNQFQSALDLRGDLDGEG